MTTGRINQVTILRTWRSKHATRSSRDEGEQATAAHVVLTRGNESTPTGARNEGVLPPRPHSIPYPKARATYTCSGTAKQGVCGTRAALRGPPHAARAEDGCRRASLTDSTAVGSQHRNLVSPRNEFRVANDLRIV